MNGNPLKMPRKGEKHVLASTVKDLYCSLRHRRTIAPTTDAIVHHLHHHFVKNFLFSIPCALQGSRTEILKNCGFCCVRPPAPLRHMHTPTPTHTLKLAFYSPALLCEAAWQTPVCRIKTYHQLSFSPRRPGDFMWGFTNLVRYLFISSVIKGLGSVMPLVRTTMLWNPLSDGF